MGIAIADRAVAARQADCVSCQTALASAIPGTWTPAPGRRTVPTMRAFLLVVLSLSAVASAQANLSSSEIAAMKRQGYVLHSGRWRLPQEVAYLQRAAALQRPAMGGGVPTKLPAAVDGTVPGNKARSPA